MLLLALGWQRAGDIYWIPGAVGAVASVALYDESFGGPLPAPRFARRWLLFGILGGVATVFRLTVGVLAIAVVLAAALVRGRESWRRRGLRLAAAVMIIVLPRLIVRAAEAPRDRYFASTAAAAGPMPSEHLFWHSIYIGLGISPNPYGLVYKDSVARNLVRNRDPGAPYMSARYERVLRDRVANLARTDPLFVVRQMLVKCLLLTPLLLCFAVLIPAMRRARTDRPMHRFALACVMGMGAGLLPGLIVVPISTYLCGAISLFIVAAVLALVANHRRDAPPLELGLSHRRSA
jgi:hypothetical protein